MATPHTNRAAITLVLPPELLQQVAKSLSKSDLKNLRLVSKMMTKYVACIVFDAIYLSTDPLDLEKAELVFKHYRGSIKIVGGLSYGVQQDLDGTVPRSSQVRSSQITHGRRAIFQTYNAHAEAAWKENPIVHKTRRPARKFGTNGGAPSYSIANYT